MKNQHLIIRKGIMDMSMDDETRKKILRYVNGNTTAYINVNDIKTALNGLLPEDTLDGLISENSVLVPFKNEQVVLALLKGFSEYLQDFLKTALCNYKILAERFDRHFGLQPGVQLADDNIIAGLILIMSGCDSAENSAIAEQLIRIKEMGSLAAQFTTIIEAMLERATSILEDMPENVSNEVAESVESKIDDYLNLETLSRGEVISRLEHLIDQMQSLGLLAPDIKTYMDIKAADINKLKRIACTLFQTDHT